MTDEAAAIEVPFHSRVRAGMRQVHNWTQLLRFLAVGASGYVVNLAVFALAHTALGVDYRPPGGESPRRNRGEGGGERPAAPEKPAGE